MRFMLPRFFPKRNVRVTGLGHRFLDTLGKKRFNFPLPFRRGSQLKEAIAKMLKEGADLRLQMIETMTGDILEAAKTIADTLKAGRKVLLFGNGGSAADCQHIAAEFMNRFLIERPPLPAIALTTDTSILTSILNDYAFDEVFSKQIKALGKKGDIAFGISTSGSSPNGLKAVRVARKQGTVTIALMGEGGKGASRAGIAAPSCAIARTPFCYASSGSDEGARPLPAPAPLPPLPEKQGLVPGIRVPRPEGDVLRRVPRGAPRLSGGEGFPRGGGRGGPGQAAGRARPARNRSPFHQGGTFPPSAPGAVGTDLRRGGDERRGGDPRRGARPGGEDVGRRGFAAGGRLLRDGPGDGPVHPLGTGVRRGGGPGLRGGCRGGPCGITRSPPGSLPSCRGVEAGGSGDRR